MTLRKNPNLNAAPTATGLNEQFSIKANRRDGRTLLQVVG
jgi:hypothetical protein